MGWNLVSFDIEYNWDSNSIMYSYKKAKEYKSERDSVDDQSGGGLGLK